jgi:hypothetical protein
MPRRPAHQFEQLPAKKHRRHACRLVPSGKVVDPVDLSLRAHGREGLLLPRLHVEITRPGDDRIEPRGHEQRIVPAERFQER